MMYNRYVSLEQFEDLKHYFSSHKEIVAAYLFGSVAEGVARADSDVDIALLLDESLMPESILEYRMEMIEDTKGILKKEVDMIVMNGVSLLLQFQVIKRGCVLFEGDTEKRALYQMKVVSMYYDYKRFFDYHAKNLRKRIKEVGLGVRSENY